MSKSQSIAVKVRTAPALSQELLDATRELPLPLQLSFLRRYYKITQGELAAALGIKQAYFSRLEEDAGNHLMSHYAEVAKALGVRIVVLPSRARVLSGSTHDLIK